MPDWLAQGNNARRKSIWKYAGDGTRQSRGGPTGEGINASQLLSALSAYAIRSETENVSPSGRDHLPLQRRTLKPLIQRTRRQHDKADEVRGDLDGADKGIGLARLMHETP